MIIFTHFAKPSTPPLHEITFGGRALRLCLDPIGELIIPDVPRPPSWIWERGWDKERRIKGKGWETGRVSKGNGTGEERDEAGRGEEKDREGERV